MNRHQVPGRLALLALLFAGVGCSIPPTRITFPEQMADANKKLKGLAGKLLIELQSLKDPGPDLEADRVERVKKLYKETEELVAQLKKEYNPGLLPSRSSGNAPKLLEAYQKFLAVEETIVTTHLQQVVTILEDPKQRRDEKWNLIKQQLDEARELETPALQEVKKVQGEYAKEHYYSLVAERPRD